MDQTTMREVIIVEHTTCGYAYEIKDAKTGESLTDVMYWYGEDEDESGMGYYYDQCAKRGLKVVGEEWS